MRSATDVVVVVVNIGISSSFTSSLTSVVFAAADYLIAFHSSANN
jgi:hypothetical protein